MRNQKPYKSDAHGSYSLIRIWNGYIKKYFRSKDINLSLLFERRQFIEILQQENTTVHIQSLQITESLRYTCDNSGKLKEFEL